MPFDLARLASDAFDLVTGRRPEVRNRVKFFLLSPIYDGFYRWLGFDPHRAIEARLAPGVRRVLDICTGTALVPAVVAAARPGCLVVGLDLSPDMLAVGREKIARLGLRNVPLVRADAGRLPFPNASFDAVTVSYGLHELPTDVRERAFREVARVLGPGGSLVVADLDRPPRLGWLVDFYLRVGEPAHARAVVGDGLARLLRSAGFAVERAAPPGSAHAAPGGAPGGAACSARGRYFTLIDTRSRFAPSLFGELRNARHASPAMPRRAGYWDVGSSVKSSGSTAGSAGRFTSSWRIRS